MSHLSHSHQPLLLLPPPRLQSTGPLLVEVCVGGAIHDLCINGGGRPVMPENVFEYVQKYTLLRMVTWCEFMLKVSGEWLKGECTVCAHM